eukprot:9967760-Lingulodinium_polyedra.AAC.1
MSAWIAAWGGGAPRGAEELAWELAVELEEAEASGRVIAGAALDWRKAFDHIPLPTVRTGLLRAGVPRWLVGCVCSAYEAPRRIRVDGALGECWIPTSGILPGCALAVFVLRVLLVPWERAVEAESDVARRIYVDDLTFWRVGADDG